MDGTAIKLAKGDKTERMLARALIHTVGAAVPRRMTEMRVWVERAERYVEGAGATRNVLFEGIKALENDASWEARILSEALDALTYVDPYEPELLALRYEGVIELMVEKNYH